MPPRRPGISALRVLDALVEGNAYGFDIMDRTGLPSGTVYPVLGRLERGGLVRSRWEDVRVARAEKRPPRRYYSITGAGATVLREHRTRLDAAREADAAQLDPRPARG